MLRDGSRGIAAYVGRAGIKVWKGKKKKVMGKSDCGAVSGAVARLR